MARGAGRPSTVQSPPLQLGYALTSTSPAVMLEGLRPPEFSSVSKGDETQSFLISLFCLDWQQVSTWKWSLGSEYQSHSIREEGLLAQPPALM